MIIVRFSCRVNSVSAVESLRSELVAAVNQANELLGMIKHNFIDRSEATVLALYKSLVRPHLYYCIQVWNPHLAKNIKLIEFIKKEP